MEYFVSRSSVVRQIWGNADTVLLIFAGASAEFALNKSVDWLYFTGKLPSDPLGRLFSTVNYAQKIVFAEKSQVYEVIESMNCIHTSVAKQRGFQIPNHAFQDVLNMLIDYSILSFELLERPMTYTEKEEVFKVFRKLGEGMNIRNLPKSFNEWVIFRHSQMASNLQYSQHSTNLFAQYRKHLGQSRYFLLKEAYRLLTPPHIQKLLNLKRPSYLKGMLLPYKLLKKLKLDRLIKKLLLPGAFQKEIADLNWKGI